MTLLLATLLALVVGFLVGVAAEQSRIARIVRSGRLWQLPGFGEDVLKKPVAWPPKSGKPN
jgi:hypothetical protein